MGEIDVVIRANCPRFVCRVCRTKTGWPHQRWCGLGGLTDPACEACRYYAPDRDRCVHPAQRKGGVGHEADRPF